MAALRGAEQTLRRFKPKLAVCVYHHFDDFWTIPQYLDQLGVGYRFYLRHSSINAEEAVLFARDRLMEGCVSQNYVNSLSKWGKPVKSLPCNG